MKTPVHFGKYLLIDKVSTGGMAELFLAKQSGLKGFEKMMAIKRILPHLTEDGEFISMFINEAKLAALLTHQNIVQIFDLGHVENSYFIAMEYVMGKDLRTILQRARTMNMPMTVGHALLIMSKVCAGLDYAHRKKDLSGQDLNIVHRDVSPQNILVSYEGEVKLVDFGIAKAAIRGSETRTGILKGKLSYMAPEQASGKAVDRRADIFAIGVVLYEILTGHRLFKGDNDFNTLEKVREAKVDPPITSLNKKVAPELEAITLKALAREANDRYQAASEMQTALEDHMSQKGYDFSTVRLAQYLQTLFQHDIEQDSQRFRIVGGAVGATVPLGIADQSTVVRKHATGSESTPSHARRRLRTPVSPPAPAGPSILRITVLTVLIIMGSATLLAMINPPFLASLSKSYPEVYAITFRLSQWPVQTLEKTSAFLKTGTVSPTPPSVSSGPSEPGPTGNMSNGTPAAVPPSAPPAIEPVSDELAAVPSEITDESDRTLTSTQKEEIRMLLREARTAYAESRLDDMERILRRIIELNPKVPVVYHLLGTVMVERKDPDAAVRIFEDATRKFPSFPLLHYDLGFLYFRKGVVSLAKDELQMALTLNPGAPMAERARVIVKEIQDSPPDRTSEGADAVAPLPHESSGSKP